MAKKSTATKTRKTQAAKEKLKLSLELPKLEDYDNVAPSAYNPRETDPKRIEWIKSSLRKLGWLNPIFATVNNEIISGHQRHLSAGQLGAKRVPIQRVKPMTLIERKGINIAFNRATNDLRRSVGTDDVAGELFKRSEELMALANELPDLDMNSEEALPCVTSVTMRSPDEIIKINPHALDHTGQEGIVRQLMKRHIYVPCVVDEDGKLVNGAGRIKQAQLFGIEKYPTVEISNLKAEFARNMMNLLSMDFTIHEKYVDELRYSSFRDMTKKNLGWAMCFRALGGVQGNASDFDYTDPKMRDEWIKCHGRSILDVGAGRGDDATKMRSMGVDVTEFEPYRKKEGKKEPSKAVSVGLMNKFLDDINSGKVWHSIFQNSVMNSVPFAEDRKALVRIIAASCSNHTHVFNCAASKTAQRWQAHQEGKDSMNFEWSPSFVAGYEEGVAITDISKRIKMQKFHDGPEWKALWSTGFKKVKIWGDANSLVFAECWEPRKIGNGEEDISPEDLRKALELEFDLPYPNGTKMGLVPKALAAFSKKHGVEL